MRGWVEENRARNQEKIRHTPSGRKCSAYEIFRQHTKLYVEHHAWNYSLMIPSTICAKNYTKRANRTLTNNYNKTMRIEMFISHVCSVVHVIIFSRQNYRKGSELRNNREREREKASLYDQPFHEAFHINFYMQLGLSRSRVTSLLERRSKWKQTRKRIS